MQPTNWAGDGGRRTDGILTVARRHWEGIGVRRLVEDVRLVVLLRRLSKGRRSLRGHDA